jgi:hypothetical protein
VDAEAVTWAWGRLALAVLCVAALIAARWRHERALAEVGRALDEAPAWLKRLERRPAAARAGRSGGGVSPFGRRVPSIAYPLYWLGLTTSAALAAQAISVLLVVAQ